MTASRAGFSVVELLVAILISVLALSLSASAFSTHLRIAQRALRNLEGDRAAGLAWSILSGELRGTSAVSDYRIGSGDSLRTRVFRGSAWLCPGDPVRPVRAAFQGDRSPNVAKDSVLALTDSGDWIALGLSRVGPQEICPSTRTPVRRWTLTGSTAAILYMRLFETGTYSVGSGALRYRSGRGGRQPVTAERFDSAATLQGAGALPRVGVAATLPIVADEYVPTTVGGRRVAWPRRSIP